MEKIANQLGINWFDDWGTVPCDCDCTHHSKVRAEDMVKNGGSGILNYYNGSLRKCLETLYPEYNWNENFFQQKKAARK